MPSLPIFWGESHKDVGSGVDLQTQEIFLASHFPLYPWYTPRTRTDLQKADGTGFFLSLPRDNSPNNVVRIARIEGNIVTRRELQS